MKITLYLGSFNPFHNGHLKVTQQALRNFKMDKVVIVPTMQNPWKKENPIEFDKRFYIIYRSLSVIKENDRGLYTLGMPDGIELSIIETKLTPPYYSYSTLHALKNKYCNDEIFILCGEDTINDIPNWMNGEQIIQDYNFLICDRTKESSTEVRNRVKNNEDIGDLVSPSVIDIIKNYYKS